MRFLNAPATLALLLALPLSSLCEGIFPFLTGKEHTYPVKADITAGTEDYVAFASTFNITGVLHVQNTGNLLNIKLDDIKFGAYNGEFDLTPSSVSTQVSLAPLLETREIRER